MRPPLARSRTASSSARHTGAGSKNGTMTHRPDFRFGDGRSQNQRRGHVALRIAGVFTEHDGVEAQPVGPRALVEHRSIQSPVVDGTERRPPYVVDQLQFRHGSDSFGSPGQRNCTGMSSTNRWKSSGDDAPVVIYASVAPMSS